MSIETLHAFLSSKRVLQGRSLTSNDLAACYEDGAYLGREWCLLVVENLGSA